MLDIVSILVTIISMVISIGSAIDSRKHSKKAKQYKEETLQFIDTLELEHLIVQFKFRSNSFLEKTREKQWDKGWEANSIISPFKEILLSFGSVYDLIDNEKELRDKVHTLNEIIQTYHRASEKEKKETNNLILEITEILYKEAKSNRHKLNLLKI